VEADAATIALSLAPSRYARVNALDVTGQIGNLFIVHKFTASSEWGFIDNR
jgi:hypothetical protein